MSNEMMKAFNVIVKERNDNGEQVTPLIMFAQAWEHKNQEIERHLDEINSMLSSISISIYGNPDGHFIDQQIDEIQDYIFKMKNTG